ncbi:ATPase [bacterium]|nr:ATPase [bacterium]
MTIAIPIAEGRLAQHFGHCAQFAIISVDPDTKEILARTDVDAPPHQPGLLPQWLAVQGVTTVIAGGMGQRAQDIFHSEGIATLIGAPADTPERLVAAHLAGTLKLGDNVCDH